MLFLYPLHPQPSDAHKFLHITSFFVISLPFKPPRGLSSLFLAFIVYLSRAIIYFCFCSTFVYFRRWNSTSCITKTSQIFFTEIFLLLILFFFYFYFAATRSVEFRVPCILMDYVFFSIYISFPATLLLSPSTESIFFCRGSLSTFDELSTNSEKL